MRHRFLTVTVTIVLIGLVSGQFPVRNEFQSFNYASVGNGPQAPVNYGNLQNFAPYNQASFFSNSGSGIPPTNVQSNPAAGQASNPASASIFPQISNQPPINNFQYANSFANPVDTQLSSADSIMSSIETNPLLKQFLPDSTNANPVTNGAQLIHNPQNGLHITYKPGTIINSLENDPLLKQLFQGPTGVNPATNGAQLIQNSQNGFPVPYVTGSNPLPNVNTGPGGVGSSTSFFPPIPYQPPINNIQSPNSFVNPVGSQLSPADSVMNSLENNPLIKQFLQGPTNPVTNGAQVIQNSQNGYPNPVPNGLNSLPNVNPSDTVLSSLESNPLIKDFLNDPANQRQVINPAPNPLPNANPSNIILNSFGNIPIRNRGPRPFRPRRRYRGPFPIRSNSFPNSNSWSSVDNFNTDGTEISPGGNKPTNPPTLLSFSLTDDSSNNPTPSDVPTFSSSMTDKPSTSSVLNSRNSSLDYPLPSDVPLEFPKSDFPEGFFVDMLKSLGANSKSASTVAAIQPKRRRKCKAQRSRTGTDNSSKSTVAANTESTDFGSSTMAPSDSVDSTTLSNIGTIKQVSDSSQADTKLTTVYPSDILKQFTLSNIKVLNSLRASKAPITRKKKNRKRPKIKVTDLVSKIPYYSDLTSADTLPLTVTPQMASTKSVTIIDTETTNKNSDLTTVGLISVQSKKKKKCNKTSVKSKADLPKGRTDIIPSFIGENVEGILNLSNASNNNDTNFRSSEKRQKSKKCQRKKERMKAAITKGLTLIPTAAPTDVMPADNAKQDGATTDTTDTKKDADKTTTVGPDPCGEDEIWWNCIPRNNTCENFARGKSQKNPNCEAGCYCTDDLIKDVDGNCVDPDDCTASICKDEDHEETTDCLLGCNRCEDDCHKPCKMNSCYPGCDCKDGFKRDDDGTCVLDIYCPPCNNATTDTTDTTKDADITTTVDPGSKVISD